MLVPTVREMARRGTPFAGLLYAGLALTRRGLRVVEFNARFGDPETQPLLQVLDSPLGVLLQAAAQGRLDEVDPPRWKDGAAVAVVVAAADYPGTPRKGDLIRGIEDAEALEGVAVLHAGTATTDGRPGHRGRPGAGRHRPSARRSRTLAPVRTKGWPGSTSTAATTAPTSPQASEGVHRVPPQRPRHPLRGRRPRGHLVARAQDRARAAAVDRGAQGPARPRRRRARRRRRGLREGRRPGRPRVDRGAGAGHPARREGPDRGVLGARRPRAHPQGHDLARPDRERRAAPGAVVAAARPGARRRDARPAGPAGRRARGARDGRPLAQRRRAGHDAREALRHGRRRAARRSRAARGAGRPLPAARHQGTGRHLPGHARPARRRRHQARRARAAGRRAPRLRVRAHQRRPGVPAVPRLRRRLGAGAAGGGPVQPRDHDPADGRQRAGHRGLPGGPGRLLARCRTR